MGKTHPKPHSKEVVEAIIKEAFDNEFYYTLFSVAKSTGRRLGEYLEVRVRDIDWDKGLMFTPILKRRAYVSKPAVLTPETMNLLRLYISRNKLKDDDYVFRLKSKTAIQKAIKVYARRAKAKGFKVEDNFSFHNFRHYFVTELFRKGWTYDRIAKLTGHSSPGTLVNYDSTVATDVQEAALNALKDI